jgi:hypothetical protein
MEINIRQLANRLENTTSGERISALEELQVLSRTEPNLVGENSLSHVLAFLKESGSEEEYQEALDLIHRLVSHFLIYLIFSLILTVITHILLLGSNKR